MTIIRTLTSRKSFLIVALAALLLFTVAACGAAFNTNDQVAQAPGSGIFMQEQMAMGSVANERAEGYDPNMSMDDAFTDTTTVEGEFDGENRVADVDRVILKDASLQITVDDAALTIQEISTMAQEMGGWVVSANSTSNTAYNGETYSTGYVTVRVPADRLDEAMMIIRTGADKVSNENINGRDVTSEYVDMSSRVNNLKASETALVEILANARKIEDVLAVQNEITRVRGEIEVLEGQLRYYSEAAAYSSIAVSVQEVVPTIGETQVDNTWNPIRTAATAFGSLVVLGQGVVDFAIVLLIIGTPFVLIAAGVLWILRRIWRNVRRNRPAPPAPPAATPPTTTADPA